VGHDQTDEQTVRRTEYTCRLYTEAIARYNMTRAKNRLIIGRSNRHDLVSSFSLRGVAITWAAITVDRTSTLLAVNFGGPCSARSVVGELCGFSGPGLSLCSLLLAHQQRNVYSRDNARRLVTGQQWRI